MNTKNWHYLQKKEMRNTTFKSLLNYSWSPVLSEKDVDRVCIEGYISVVWKPAPVT